VPDVGLRAAGDPSLALRFGFGPLSLLSVNLRHAIFAVWIEHISLASLLQNRRAKCFLPRLIERPIETEALVDESLRGFPLFGSEFGLGLSGHRGSGSDFGGGVSGGARFQRLNVPLVFGILIVV
jgi:hypothetical protein